MRHFFNLSFSPFSSFAMKRKSRKNFSTPHTIFFKNEGKATWD
ncbi:hypothetical protein LEP1GSC172_4436 [Leptospira noguchii]|uniref:Uncharacterized protein n=1 Tax=Leptospira noguchii TaxID=28182 RepID=M6VW96_9LEPT|nr:hypothetical protein LEP1GSC172_4436 [Leptospira noguchii]